MSQSLPDDFPSFEVNTPTKPKAPAKPREIVISTGNMELVPSLILACRICLAITVAVYTFRTLTGLGTQNPLLSTGMQLELAVYGYATMLGVWLSIEAVGELHRCRKLLEAVKAKN